jgi:hypothetical protein
MDRYTTPEPFEPPTWEGQPDFHRADLHLYGVGHRGDSYEGRIFLNAGDASPETPLSLDAGYAGSFYVFGHGPCYGDEGHCAVPQGPLHPFDYRRPHPLNPQVIAVPITEALRKTMAAGADAIEVTIVPTNPSNQDVGDILFVERLGLITYD